MYHYDPKVLIHDGKTFDDPVDALRAALIEDERRGRELTKKYNATQASDDFEDLFG